MDKTSYLCREWSNIGEMWHADAEWHDNYGDEVKIEIEKDDGLKTKNCSLVVQVISPGYSNVAFFTRVVQLHNLLNCCTGILYAQLAGRFYGYTAEMASSVCLNGKLNLVEKLQI